MIIKPGDLVTSKSSWLGRLYKLNSDAMKSFSVTQAFTNGDVGLVLCVNEVAQEGLVVYSHGIHWFFDWCLTTLEESP